MIREHRRFNIQDLSNRRNDVEMEVNWNDAVNECRYIKLQLGDREAIISKEHLWTILFMLSENDKQEQMLPVSQTPVTNYSTVVNVKSKHDIKKGQEYALPISISLNHLTNQVSIKP